MKISFYVGDDGLIHTVSGLETLKELGIYKRLKILQCLRNKIEREIMGLMIKNADKV